MDQPYRIGGNYQLRTVTHIITGRIESVGPLEIVVSSAAWIADTGRYSQAVAAGEYDEVEPYPDDRLVIVGRQSIVDSVEIPNLPRAQK